MQGTPARNIYINYFQVKKSCADRPSRLQTLESILTFRKVKEINHKHILARQKRIIFIHRWDKEDWMLMPRQSLSALLFHEIFLIYEHLLIPPGTWSRQQCTNKGAQRTIYRSSCLCLSSSDIHFLSVLRSSFNCSSMSTSMLSLNMPHPLPEALILSSPYTNPIFDMTGSSSFNSAQIPHFLNTHLISQYPS